MTLLELDTDVPPSARHVAHVLQEVGPFTLRELIEYTSSPPATVKNALARLKAEGLISSNKCLDDCRVHSYDFNEQESF